MVAKDPVYGYNKINSHAGAAGITEADKSQNNNYTGGFPMEKDKLNHSYKVEEIGQVQIADEVIAVIAGLTATEVDGVAKMSGNITNEIVSKLGMKNLSSGVKVEILGEEVEVKLSLVLNYGVSIPKTSREVQEKVKNAIETMTGLTVIDVNIRIAGVQMDEGQK